MEYDSYSSSQSSLTVEKVPDKHFKEVWSREVNTVHELHIFLVPPKTEKMERAKIIRHKPIVFYQAESFNPNHKNEGKEATGEISDGESSDKHLSIEVSRIFGENSKSLTKKTPCPTTVSKSMMARFAKMWYGSHNRITGLDGKMKYSCCLGYQSDDEGSDGWELPGSPSVTCHMATDEVDEGKYF